MMRIYLSGPMTGLPELNYPAFNAAASMLRVRGYDVVNPAENPKQPDWESYMRMDIAQMLTCDAVAQLPGWGLSRGAKLEAHVAAELGIKRGILSEYPTLPQAADRGVTHRLLPAERRAVAAEHYCDRLLPGEVLTPLGRHLGGSDIEGLIARGFSYNDLRASSWISVPPAC